MTYRIVFFVWIALMIGACGKEAPPITPSEKTQQLSNTQDDLRENAYDHR